MPQEKNGMAKTQSFFVILNLALIVMGTLFALLMAPYKARIEANEKEIRDIKIEHKAACQEADKKYSSAAVVEVQLQTMTAILDDIKAQLQDCRESDKDFQKRFQRYIDKDK